MAFDGRWEAHFTIPSGTTLIATNNGGGPTLVTIPPTPSVTISQLVAIVAGALTTDRPPSSGAWSVTLSTGLTGTGRVTISISAGSFAITWGSGGGALRDMLGFDVDLNTSVVTATGAAQARGLWRPDAVLRCAADARRAPLATDHRVTVSPTGEVYALKSTRMFRHSNPRYSHVPADRVWEAQALVPNTSYETFIKDTQLGEGHAWFALSAPVTIIDHASALVGGDANGGAGLINGWSISTLPGLDTLEFSQGIENGIFYRLEWPEFVSSG